MPISGSKDTTALRSPISMTFFMASLRGFPATAPCARHLETPSPPPRHIGPPAAEARDVLGAFCRLRLDQKALGVRSVVERQRANAERRGNRRDEGAEGGWGERPDFDRDGGALVGPDAQQTG